jgi:hypothetical protein
MTLEELKEWRGRLHDRSADALLSREERRLAKQAGIVVAFAQGEDKMRFVGAVNAELSAWRGTRVYFDADGLLLDTLIA